MSRWSCHHHAGSAYGSLTTTEMDTLLLSRVLLGVLIFVVSSVGGLAVAGAIVVKLPSDYFSPSRKREFLTGRHPALRVTCLILKNVAGFVVVALGILLSTPGIPGPGILTILIGIMLLDFPGKRRLERWMVCRPRVRKSIDRLRARYGKPPLVLDSD